MNRAMPWSVGFTLALAACGGGDSDELNGALNQIAAEANSAPEAPANAAMTAIDRDLIVGRWSDQFGCQGPISEFEEDGTLRIGDREGTWSLEGNTLTITGNGRTDTARLNYVNSTDIDGTLANGGLLHSFRCPDQ